MRTLYTLCLGAFLLIAFQVQAEGPFGCGDFGLEYACCCETCSCNLCGQLESCDLWETGGASPSNDCQEGGENNCGWYIDNGVQENPNPCSEWYDNASVATGYTYPACVPIDGGLGFLIAGGLGIGVIGIRRRKEELELELERD